jgi:hypothetical protein
MAKRRYYSDDDKMKLTEAVCVWLSAVPLEPGRWLTEHLLDGYQAWASWAGAPMVETSSMFSRILTSLGLDPFRVAAGRGFEIRKDMTTIRTPPMPTVIGLRAMVRECEKGWWPLADLHGAWKQWAPELEAAPRYVGTILVMLRVERRGSGDAVEFEV